MSLFKFGALLLASRYVGYGRRSCAHPIPIQMAGLPSSDALPRLGADETLCANVLCGCFPCPGDIQCARCAGDDDELVVADAEERGGLVMGVLGGGGSEDHDGRGEVCQARTGAIGAGSATRELVRAHTLHVGRCNHERPSRSAETSATPSVRSRASVMACDFLSLNVSQRLIHAIRERGELQPRMYVRALGC
ncbi:hypothetical protein OG21DRAFT_1511660 [Imleria badia]|nr:hypothetical protein OG21DRAFT_1511660 [Imleria badia]